MGAYAGGMPGLTSQLPLGTLLGFQVQVSFRSWHAPAVCAPRQIGPYGGGSPGSRSQVPVLLGATPEAGITVARERASRQRRSAIIVSPGSSSRAMKSDGSIEMDP